MDDGSHASRGMMGGMHRERERERVLVTDCTVPIFGEIGDPHGVLSVARARGVFFQGPVNGELQLVVDQCWPRRRWW